MGHEFDTATLRESCEGGRAGAGEAASSEDRIDLLLYRTVRYHNHDCALLYTIPTGARPRPSHSAQVGPHLPSRSVAASRFFLIGAGEIVEES